MTARASGFDPAAVRATLRAAGLRARSSLSQNFLADPDVLETILRTAEPTPGARIVEIGPGLGILTGALLEAGADVTAIELDRGLAAFLRDAHADAIARAGAAGAEPEPAAEPERRADREPPRPGRLRLIEGDALDLDLVGLAPPPYDVVANIPYHITSPILHALLGGAPRPRRIVLMVQREVAERIAAPPGGMSYLSVFVQYHAKTRIAAIVPPEAFEPAPKVASAIVVLEPYPDDDRLADDAAEDALWRLVQASFRERRKMLHNVLVRQLSLPRDVVERALAAADIATDRRPQTLAVGEWLKLREAMGPIAPDARGRRAE